jgi:hypothetical protein
MSESAFPKSIEDLPHELQERIAELFEQYAASVERGEPACLESFFLEYPHLRSTMERMVADIDVLCRISTDRKIGASVDFDSGSVTKGTVLGDFEILREVGRGGMGIVYLARQQSLQRSVALKMLPFAAILDPNQIARFHTEAQAAASLHHPNIVPVYSVGCERGVHYYSMQYIDGQAAEAFLDSLRNGSAMEESRVDSTSFFGEAARIDSVPNGIHSTRRTRESSHYVRQIVGKMADVAKALDFAHARGVVHRDIKPSNLMIDRQGNFWLTDFGLARVQDGQSVTIAGDLLGTLRYMSPEQANGRSHLVDHRADIYSFGVTLYELLTLQCAFLGSDRFEVLAAIQRAKPVSPRAINPAIPADLETIIAKCMSFEKDDRYATAGEIADDLNRFLNHQPIAARRPSAVDRLGKWALRKKKWVAVAAVAMLMLALGSITFAFVILQQRSRAEMFASNAQLIVDRFGSDFADQLEGIPGTEPIRRRILNETSEYYSQLVRYSQEDSALARQSAHAAHRLAVISQRLGNIEAAGIAYRDALERWTRFRPIHKMTPEDAIDMAACHRDFAILQSKLGDHQSARKHFDSSLSTLESIGDGKEDDLPRLIELAKTRSELSSFLAKMENKKAAIAMLRQSVEELEHSLGRDSKTLRIERIGQITIALNNQASIVLDQDPGQAAWLLHRAAKMRLDLGSENEFRLNDRMLGAILHGNLGVAERKLGHAIVAEGQFQQAIDALDAILETHPDYVKAHVELAACYNNWAQLHLDNRDPDRAKSCFEEAKSLLTAAQLRFPMQPEIPRFLQIIQKNISGLNGEEMSARIDDGKSKTMLVFEGEGSRYRQ